jgi:hypothetical protein
MPISGLQQHQLAGLDSGRTWISGATPTPQPMAAART